MRINKLTILSAAIAAVMLLNTSVGLNSAYAEDANNNTSNSSTNGFSSRFPVGGGTPVFGNSTNSNNADTEAELEEGQSWVDMKDDWRHGQTGAASSSGSNKTGATKLGMAQGAYAVGLPSNTPGSTYYWYHQSSSCGNCEYCGDWGIATWGSGGKFASDGCAMFSAAMLVSNLTGQEITPLKFLEDIGCEINDNNTYISTSSCEWLNDHSIAKGGEEFANFICEKYGLQNTGSLATYDKSKMQSAIDDVLSKGGMVWYRFSNPNDEVSQWVTTSSHFICIREKIDDKYYTLDSCNRPDSAGATEPVTFDTIYNRLYSGTDYMIGFWNGAAGSSNNSGTTGNSGNVPVGTGGWYGAGTDIPTYSNTKDLGDGFYLYNGLPWAANASTVTIDTDTMLIDMFNYAKNVSTTKTAKATLFGSGGTCEAVDVLTTHDRMHADPTGVSPDGGNWKSCDGGRLYVEIDGVKASGVGTIPAIMNPDFNRGFGPYDESTGVNYWNIEADPRVAMNHGTKKLAFALLEKSTGDIWYLPASPISCKGASYPGGVAQTNMTTYNEGYSSVNKGQLDSNNMLKTFTVWKAGSGTDFYKKYENKDISELMDVLNAEDNSGYTSWDVCYDIGEFWHTPQPVAAIIESGDYALVGAVHWMDT